ncbi:hypothetical protein DSM110093_04254 (plasmid) [Sulfitobacter sp. DSM 110093]|nr:hypothetical protein DSM110093_04254 [Sulfitobacter sp. DSM 110093]
MFCLFLPRAACGGFVPADSEPPEVAQGVVSILDVVGCCGLDSYIRHTHGACANILADQC